MVAGYRLYAALVFIPALVLCPGVSAAPTDLRITDDLRVMVRADWTEQEQRKNRRPSDAAAIEDAFKRTRRLLTELLEMPSAPDLEAQRARLATLRAEKDRMNVNDDQARSSLYFRIRMLTREIALKNPLIAGRRILFLKRRRFICQMLHEYNGYYYDYADIAGGGVHILKEPGRSLEIADLVKGRLPKGNYTTLSLSYDGQTIYFAFARRSRSKTNYSDRNGFHIHSVDVDGEDITQLTSGPYDDFDPCPLPGGGVAFMSSRRGGFCRCNNPWEPLSSYNLHRMDADGANIQTLSFHETNEWHPSVLNDGRIIYIRWDYVDRSAANFHGLWITNPDGTNPVALFGNYTMRINACYQPKAVPGSTKVAFLAGAHHADVGGSLILLDPAVAGLDEQSGQDRFDSIEVLTPEVCFPEAPGWPKTYYHSPWPLSENYFLVSFSPDPLPGMGPKVNDDMKTGLYYFDRFGNLELLYADDDISCMYPIPLSPRPAPPVVPTVLDPRLGDEGEFFVSNIYESHFPLPQSRRITALRIFQVLPKESTHIVNQPRIGHANAESARMMLGTVPVESDGSAYFRAPARKPLYFQAVDERGRAVQSMRSITYLQPGESRGCVGCHERRGKTTDMQARPKAMKRSPSIIQPGPQGTKPFSYPLLVQPVLDDNCIRCHDGSTGPDKSPLDLTVKPQGTFTKSYMSLKPFIRWYEWGGSTITPIVTKPGRIGADVSPLTRIIGDATHAPHVHLSDEDQQRLNIWLDGNVPFYGTYDVAAQQAQLLGKAVPPPPLQ
jgi:hypothetical protein